MFSYVYMKILESQPDRYDRGIRWLSFGQSERTKRRVVDEHVTRGTRVLDIGCGTGTLAILAAKKGAEVSGFDVSGAMLDVARKKIASEGLEQRIVLRQMGVAGMDELPEAGFDLVTATLVFSELSQEERLYTVRQVCRVLKPRGRLVAADEVRPTALALRLIHAATRLPLAVVTFVLTQTTTRPVDGLEELVARSGFEVVSAERSRLGSFLYLVAVKR